MQRRFDAATRDFLGVAAAPDFARPPGAAALVAADSASWRLFRNPITLFIGGIAAVLLELSEPRVRDAVWQHSSFRRDPLTRLRRTGLAAMVTVYGPADRARAMIAGVVRAHARVTGATSAGQPYRASDPLLLDWVQATAGYGFMQACHHYARALPAAERDRLFAEALPAARLYGATGAPANIREMDALLARMAPLLEPSPILFELLAILERMPAFPAITGPLQHLLIKAAVDLVPDWLRSRLGFGARWSLRVWERPLVIAAARAADRIVVRASPAVQSCRRLGLPDDYLYRR